MNRLRCERLGPRYDATVHKLLGQLFEFADNVFTSNSVHYTSGPGTYGGGAVEVAAA